MKIKWPAFGFGCLLLASAAVMVQHVSAQAAHETSTTTATPPASISNVEVAQAGQETVVRISGTGDLQYQVSRLDSPARLVLDFADTRLALAQRRVNSEFVPVLGVRLGQPVPGKSRVVIDLEKNVPFNAKTEGSSLVVSFTPPAVEAIPVAPRPVRMPVETKSARQQLVAMHVPEMPLPAWLSGKDFGFAAPSV